MNASTRRRSAWALSSAVWVVGVVSGLTFGSPSRAEADVIVRFVNGREIVAREHWFGENRVSFTHGGGTVAVPRDFVVAIEAVGAQREIRGGPQPVNAPPLVAPDPIR